MVRICEDMKLCAVERRLAGNEAVDQIDAVNRDSKAGDASIRLGQLPVTAEDWKGTGDFSRLGAYNTKRS